MPSVVEICNQALDKLGHGPITSLTDGTTASNLCNRNWPIVRDEVLRDHPWNFAITRTSTSPSTDTPGWGFTYQHTLPTDCLRVLEVKDMLPGEYQLESQGILADDSILYIRYVKRETDPNKYDSMFVNAVACRLALEMCESLTQSNTKKDALWREYDEWVNKAKSADAKENPPAPMAEDDWIRARL